MNKSCFFCALIGIVINSMLGLIKLALGILTNSLTIIIDAFNNIIDMSSSFILLIIKKEYISELIITILMLIMSIYFTYNSIYKIIYIESLLFNKYTFLILLITLILKIIQYYLYKFFYLKCNSKSLKVIIIETKNDIIMSISIIISISFMYYLNINIDGYIGLIVSIYMLLNSINILKNIIEN